jgi:hypothetical protein
LYIKEDAKKDPEYLKLKNVNLVVLQALKKYYNQEPNSVRQAIVTLSQSMRKEFPELNEEIPL